MTFLSEVFLFFFHYSFLGMWDEKIKAGFYNPLFSPCQNYLLNLDSSVTMLFINKTTQPYLGVCESKIRLLLSAGGLVPAILLWSHTPIGNAEHWSHSIAFWQSPWLVSAEDPPTVYPLLRFAPRLWASSLLLPQVSLFLLQTLTNINSAFTISRQPTSFLLLPRSPLPCEFTAI